MLDADSLLLLMPRDVVCALRQASVTRLKGALCLPSCYCWRGTQVTHLHIQHDG